MKFFHLGHDENLSNVEIQCIYRERTHHYFAHYCILKHRWPSSINIMNLIVSGTYQVKTSLKYVDHINVIDES